MARSLWGTPGLTEAKERHTRNEKSPVVDKLPALPANLVHSYQAMESSPSSYRWTKVSRQRAGDTPPSIMVLV